MIELEKGFYQIAHGITWPLVKPWKEMKRKGHGAN